MLGIAPNLSNVSTAGDQGGEHVDPVEDELLAETDALAAGRYLVLLTLTTTNLDQASAQFEVRHRNAANDDTVERVVVSCPVDDCKQIEIMFSLEQDERVAVTPYLLGFLGTAWVALTYQKVS